MRSLDWRPRNPAQAWQIGVLTLIVLVVGCSRSNPPHQPSASTTAARDVAQREVQQAQTKVDELGVALSKSELELANLKAKPAEPPAAEPNAEAAGGVGKEIAKLEAQIADQRAALERATKELTERNITLQKTQHEVGESAAQFR